jgi:3'(2'), 5'-bisphosphate nucleotidase
MTQPPAASSPAGIPLALAEQEIQFLCDLAERCGKIAADMRASVGIHEKDGPQDLVTDADLALSALLLKELAGRFPADFLISEEDVPANTSTSCGRIWYIDPIDGTDNYVSGDGQYSVMIGLLLNGQPNFGCVHCPAKSITYYGGPGYGAFQHAIGGKDLELVFRGSSKLPAPLRVMMGSRDRRNNPWLQDLDEIKIISSGSVGLKVAKVINDEADVYVHLSGRLKYWDTVGPIAIALAAGLEAGTLDGTPISYPPQNVLHTEPVIIGRAGTLAWAHSFFAQHSTR